MSEKIRPICCSSPNWINLVFIAFLALGLAGPILADSSTTSSNMPVPETVGTPAQEKFVIEASAKKSKQENITGKVTRAIFTSQIIDREPADDLTEISNTTERIYFFTDLRNLEGKIITHRWEYNGEVMAEVTFKVGGGPRWRVYSSKNLLPLWTGSWTVFVMNEDEQLIHSSIFNYTQAEVKTEIIIPDSAAKNKDLTDPNQKPQGSK